MQMRYRLASEMIAPPESRLFRSSFQLLYSDLRHCLEYVEPHSGNLAVFSQRTYELLLRISTEFESACKAAARSRSSPLKPTATIRDFKASLKPVHVESGQVALLFWNPEPLVLHPFEDWRLNRTLGWYAAYNQVKHDRVSHFQKASLQNVLFAFAGLFVVLISGFRHPVLESSSSYHEHDMSRAELHFPDFGVVVTLDTPA